MLNPAILIPALLNTLVTVDTCSLNTVMTVVTCFFVDGLGVKRSRPVVP